MKNKVLEKLKTYNQEHLLQFENELTESEKTNLYNQILETNFDYLSYLTNEETKKESTITPINALKSSEIAMYSDEFEKEGLGALKNMKVGALLLAGGMGTRLGSDNPKGMYNIGKTRDVYIFQRLFENLMVVSNKCGVPIPFFIMTSEKNHESTTNFLKEHNYFGYDEKYIKFFIQEMAPCVDANGKILLEEKDRLATSPNGNGGWFNSLLKNSDAKAMLEEYNIEWLNVFAVDNVLQKIADPAFIGATISGGYDVGSKVIRKVDPYEKVGVMCLKNGKPSIVEYIDLTEDMAHELNTDGERAYNFGVILNYLFNVDQLHKIKDEKLPVHIVHKKVPYIDKNGNLVNPETPNAYKFELLCVDMIELCDSCLPYEVLRNKEFAPIKNKTGVDSVESARALLEENGYEL